MTDSPGVLFQRLLDVMKRLREPGGCPWDREQTPTSLKPFLIEEAYEVLEAIESGRSAAVREELGDLLFQIVFHARLAEERGEFTMTDLLGQLIDQPWFYSGLGVTTPSLAAALALFLLAVPEFTFFLDPLLSQLSRRHEFEADAYATRNADAAKLAQALVKLYRDNASTLTPDPLHSAFYDSHPPAAVRISRLRTT